MFLIWMGQRRIWYFISLKHLQKETRRLLLFTFIYNTVSTFKRRSLLCSLLSLHIYGFKILFKINRYSSEQTNSLKNYTWKNSRRKRLWLSFNHKLLSWWKWNRCLRLCHHHRVSTSWWNFWKFHSWRND